jgi:hypothetical protein
VFNYQHCRAQSVSENCFGLLTQKCCICQRWLQQTPEHTDKVILAICAVHIFLRDDSLLFPDDKFEPGNVAFSILSHVGRNSTMEALNVRDLLSVYFTSTEGAVE